VLIVDGTLVPTRDRAVAEQSKNYRYSTNRRVVIEADIRLVVAVGRPAEGNRNACKAWEPYGAKAAVGKTTVMANGDYRGTGLVIPDRRERGPTELPACVVRKPSGASVWPARAAAWWRFCARSKCLMPGWMILLGGVARSRPSPVGGPPRVSDQAARQVAAGLLVGQDRCGVAVRTAMRSTSMG
jgi:hypothetical protein